MKSLVLHYVCSDTTPERKRRGTLLCSCLVGRSGSAGSHVVFHLHPLVEGCFLSSRDMKCLLSHSACMGKGRFGAPPDHLARVEVWVSHLASAGRLGPHFSPVVFGQSKAIIDEKFSVLLGCRFPGLLARKSRLFLGLFSCGCYCCCLCWWMFLGC